MNPKEIVEKVTAIAKPIVSSLGLELFDVKYTLKSGKWILTIFIDKQNDYVSTKDCELVSYSIEKELDFQDIIPGRYYLEVSSPGLDRPLRSIEDFERFKGKLAKVKAKKTYKGYIKDVDTKTGEIILEVNEQLVAINFSDIKAANLEIEF
ncbi:MAG: ribosome maturation factor RimP [Fervidobacterium sp.]